MALIEGVKYGLSSYQNQNPSHNNHPSSTAPVSSNKSVLFVKFTDSALKAIEEYLKIQQKTGQHATLQFLGNEGRINIPSSQGSQGQAFDFSLQSNADIEGPQGSFECIQQSSSRSLESLGALPFKMRIKANDDVYAETKQRFTALEEGRKQECAKEIKTNGADIGRKVKIKKDRIPPPMVRREPSPFHNPQQSKLSPNPNNSYGGSKISNGYNHSPSSSYNKSASGFNGLGQNNLNNGPPKASNGSSNGSLNVAKRPLKERLIHLLALKPFKKPELIARLSRDGIKDREKSLVMTILKQISTFKDNEYILMRGIWNDVQEDWPCYTEQERQLMKRRKPQNLTPPGSDSSVSSGVSGCSLSPRSTASTSSGHSPLPHHHSSQYSNNSQIGTKSGFSQRGSMSNQCGNSLGQGMKRPAPTNPAIGPDGLLLDDVSTYGDGPNTKKTRVSHFKKPVRSSGGGGIPPQQIVNNNSIHNGGVANFNPNGRSDGLSPHFNQNRIAERLSPINGSAGNVYPNGVGSISHVNSGLAHSLNHRSPHSNTIIGEQVSSPPYFNNGGSNNNQLSPQGNNMHSGDDHMGGYSPYSWNSKNMEVGGVNSHDSQGYLDTNKSRGMDSDETDSIDSGNGSSGSSSGSHRHYVNPNEDVSYTRSNNNYPKEPTIISAKSSSSSSSSSHKEPELIAGAQSATLVTIPRCDRVSSTTNGTSNGYHISPQSSPESHVVVESLQLFPPPPQKDNGCDPNSIVKSNGMAYGVVAAPAGGSTSGNSNHVNSRGSSSSVSKERSEIVEKERRSEGGERERSSRSDRERTSGRDRESRGRDRSDRDNRRDRERKSLHGVHNKEIQVQNHNKNVDGDNTTTTASTKKTAQYPPYLTKYTSIESDEQRSRYKDDFNTEYPLYRDLHAVIEKVSKKFAQLEERLREEERGSEEYQRVRDQIVKEYYASKKDRKYQEAKERFNYLHKKLTYIKTLVADYDRHSTHGHEISSPVR